jgi:ribonuclease D
MEFNTPSKVGEFQLISDEAFANRILDKILENEYAVVGMDTEAALEMSRFGILCLIQVRKIYFYFLIM